MIEQFSPGDIFTLNLSFRLDKGSSYIADRRSASFWPAGSNICKPSSGNRVIKFTLNCEDNVWLGPQSVRVFFILNNREGTNFGNFRPLSPPYSFFRRMRIIAGSQLVEDFDTYTRVHHIFSKLMS